MVTEGRIAQSEISWPLGARLMLSLYSMPMPAARPKWRLPIAILYLSSPVGATGSPRFEMLTFSAGFDSSGFAWPVDGTVVRSSGVSILLKYSWPETRGIAAANANPTMINVQVVVFMNVSLYKFQTSI